MVKTKTSQFDKTLKMAFKSPYDTLDSIRLKNRDQHTSTAQPTNVEPSSAPDLSDLDIDALDEDFKRLTVRVENDMRELRAGPTDASKKQSVIKGKEKMNQIKI
jgi:hypothetical protein